jgi:hypothetical protein
VQIPLADSQDAGCRGNTLCDHPINGTLHASDIGVRIVPAELPFPELLTALGVRQDAEAATLSSFVTVFVGGFHVRVIDCSQISNQAT